MLDHRREFGIEAEFCGNHLKEAERLPSTRRLTGADDPMPDCSRRTVVPSVSPEIGDILFAALKNLHSIVLDTSEDMI